MKIVSGIAVIICCLTIVSAQPLEQQEQPEPTPEDQLWNVFGASSSVIFQYVDYNTLTERGANCEETVMGFIRKVLGDADKQAETCNSVDDAKACYTDVENKIKQDYLNDKPEIVACLKKFRIKISKKGLDAIEDSLVKNTQSVVLSAFQKSTAENADDVANVERAAPVAAEQPTNDESTSVIGESASGDATPLAIVDAPKAEPQPSSTDESVKAIQDAPKEVPKPVEEPQPSSTEGSVKAVEEVVKPADDAPAAAAVDA